MPAERLYYDDPTLLRFEARVVELRQSEGRPALILDRTAFYPTSGGQPHDRGTIAGTPVLDVREEDGEVVHVLADPCPCAPGELVQAEVDAERRFDHMQQHTGQHILSQAFVELFEAQTVAFHLGEQACTIDLDRENLSPEDLRRVEDRANAIVFEDREVHTRFVTPEELTEVPLRKPPAGHQHVRVVEVEGFDWSACGGTHCHRTGQVGNIRLTHVERRGAETRVTFLCGWRALRDARWKHELLVEMALPFSVGLPDLPDTVTRLAEAEETARKALKRARTELLHHEARQLYEQAEPVGPGRVVRAVLAGRDPDEVRTLAQAVAALPGGVALLGAAGETARLFFARAAELPWDMGALMRRAAGVIGGRGGGRPEQAQGGGPQAGLLEEALEQALEQLRGQAH